MESKEPREINIGALKIVHVTEGKVLEILENITMDKYLGLYPVYPRIFWEVGVEIAGPLTEITIGEVLDDWRMVNVVPLFKKGRKENPGDNTPVNLTLVVALRSNGAVWLIEAPLIFIGENTNTLSGCPQTSLSLEGPGPGAGYHGMNGSNQYCWLTWTSQVTGRMEVIMNVSIVVLYCEDQVFQTPTVLRAFKGESVNITFSNWSIRKKVEMMHVSWWRSKQAENPVCSLTYINKMQIQNPLCDNRMSIILKLNASVTHFIIQDLQTNDSDLYYCKIAFHIPPPTVEIEGNKTSLVVAVPPVVEVKFLPQLENCHCVQLVCKAENLYSGDVQMRWRRERKEGSVWIDSGPIIISNNSNSVTSYVNLSHWKAGDVYSCLVNQSMLQIPLIRKLTIPLDEQQEGREYLWWVLSSLGPILIAAVVYFLLKCSKKEPEDNQIYVNVGTTSRTQETPASSQGFYQTSNYSFIHHFPLRIYENTF
ncbi:uncharacterized protein LOC125457215 [Stegostoma tigrinum]|uniref:uncharacterized protein LOC125457215 n=1 Tax=Stegostoma tigrinum TaxID=3053191 RepID=UPI00287092DD|nr:uncharacterized protein LOC125457215 [Stegostoma tigrinum]